MRHQRATVAVELEKDLATVLILACGLTGFETSISLLHWVFLFACCWYFFFFLVGTLKTEVTTAWIFSECNYFHSSSN